MSERYDGFSVVQGATFDETLKYEDDSVDPAVPMPLAGYTARMGLQDDYGDTDYALLLTTENGGLTLNASAGTIRIVITDEQSAALDAKGLAKGRPFVYDLKLIDASGYAEKLMRGIFTVYPGVS